MILPLKTRKESLEIMKDELDLANWKVRMSESWSSSRVGGAGGRGTREWHGRGNREGHDTTVAGHDEDSYKNC